MIEQKDTYTIQELFDSLSVSIAEMSRLTGLTQPTLYNLRNGGKAYRTTVNKALHFFSEHYGQVFTVRNVTGWTVDEHPRGRKRKQSGIHLPSSI